MKRIKLLILLIIPFLMTGCAENLKCEINTNNYNSSLKINFKNDKPTTYKYFDEMIFTNSLNTDCEIYYHTKYAEYNYLINNKNARITNKQNKVTIKINYNFKKESSKKEEEMLLISKNDTKEKATKKIESLGYKCK